MSGIAHPPETEPIMQALFALAQTVNTPATPFNVMSRRMLHFDDVSPDDIPAFFQFQAPGINTTLGQRGIPVKKRKVFWIAYLPGAQDKSTSVAPAMNSYYDALSNALLPQAGPNAKQTLGGLCVNCYEDGQGMADEGLLTTPSLIVIPITILNGI